MGSTARAMCSYPQLGLAANPFIQLTAAWGEVTERSFARMAVKPDWGIHSISADDGRDHIVSVEKVMTRPFGDLIRFKVQGRAPTGRKVLLVAPMSGHYATLLRSTVLSLMPDCDVYITDWHNARDIPVSAGKFDIEDYTLYLVDFLARDGARHPCDRGLPAGAAGLAATAYLAEEDAGRATAHPDAGSAGRSTPTPPPPTSQNFGNRVSMGQPREIRRASVSAYKYAGVGRMVYPGLQQLSSFMAMNAEKHAKAFTDQVVRVAKGEAGDHDKHNKFYDEYLAVMDMTAEFLPLDRRTDLQGPRDRPEPLRGRRQAEWIWARSPTVAVKTVEGGKDDISAPGQCVAALDLCTGLPDNKKASYLEPEAGHYGIFAGKSLAQQHPAAGARLHRRNCRRGEIAGARRQVELPAVPTLRARCFGTAPFAFLRRASSR